MRRIEKKKKKKKQFLFKINNFLSLLIPCLEFSLKNLQALTFGSFFSITSKRMHRRMCCLKVGNRLRGAPPNVVLIIKIYGQVLY